MNRMGFDDWVFKPYGALKAVKTARLVSRVMGAWREAQMNGTLSWKKAAATVLALLVGIFGPKAGIDTETVRIMVASLIAYVIGQGLADTGKSAEAIRKKNGGQQ
jgi:hypothetical protein